MVDLHTHIMYGWDDGAGDIAESLAMARLASADGTRTLAATPHFVIGGLRLDVEMVRDRVAEINEEAQRGGIDIRVVTGCEVPAIWDHFSLIKHRRVLMLGESRTLLLEVPFQRHPVQFKDLLFQIRMLGITPLLAHPERSEPFLHDHDLFRRTVEEDIPVQITAASLVGGLGERYADLAWEIVRQERPIVIASDGHHAETRRPRLSAAHAALTEAYGEETANLMCRDNAAALLEDRPPAIADIPRNAPAVKPSGLGQRLRRAFGLRAAR